MIYHGVICNEEFVFNTVRQTFSEALTSLFDIQVVEGTDDRDKCKNSIHKLPQEPQCILCSRQQNLIICVYHPYYTIYNGFQLYYIMTLCQYHYVRYLKDYASPDMPWYLREIPQEIDTLIAKYNQIHNLGERIPDRCELSTGNLNGLKTTNTNPF